MRSLQEWRCSGEAEKAHPLFPASPGTAHQSLCKGTAAGQHQGREAQGQCRAGPTFISRVVDGVHSHLQGRRLPVVLSATLGCHASIAGAIPLTRENRSVPAPPPTAAPLPSPDSLQPLTPVPHPLGPATLTHLVPHSSAAPSSVHGTGCR